MSLTRLQFNQEIKSFQLKHSKTWNIIITESSFSLIKYSQAAYLKAIIKESSFVISAYIVYSDSYNVPVLYLSIMIETEDSSRFASLDELKPFLTADPGSISVAENPINGLLMFNVHPCLTAEFMKEVFNSVSKDSMTENLSYIESWLSFCPINFI